MLLTKAVESLTRSTQSIFGDRPHTGFHWLSLEYDAAKFFWQRRMWLKCPAISWLIDSAMPPAHHLFAYITTVIFGYVWKKTSASFSHLSDKHWDRQQWSLPGMKTAQELSTWRTRHTQCTNAILWSDMPGQLIMWFVAEARLEMCGKHVHIHPHTSMHPMHTISHTCKHRNTCTHVWTTRLLVHITVQILCVLPPTPNLM